MENLSFSPHKLLLSKPRSPHEPPVSAGCLHRVAAAAAERWAQMDPPPCSSTESHEDLATCNKASQLSRHCAPGLRLYHVFDYFVLMGEREKCMYTPGC